MTKSNKARYHFIALVACLGFSLYGCGEKTALVTSASGTASSGYQTSSTPTVSTVINTSTGGNVIPITVNGSSCSSGNQYPNEPCVSVTICTPGTSNCQTINDILLDTGSYGLRIFSSLITVPLTQINAPSGNPVAECAEFGSGSDWGPVKMANVVLGGESAVTVPIQTINSTYATYPSSCGTPDTDPATAGFNGILGVGLFNQDCGSGCATVANNQTYYACSGKTCTETTLSLQNQVANPVYLLPKDNNGVIVQLPSVPLGGAPSLNGSLILGIGTQSNNSPAGVKAYSADASTGNFSTVFNGTSYTSFIDSGSNAYYFTASSANALPDCASPNDYFFCPTSTKSFNAVNLSSSGSVTGNFSFDIGNYDTLANSDNWVFMEMGGAGSEMFDVGLPFFYGKKIFVGFTSQSSTLGTGPYWAY